MTMVDWLLTEQLVEIFRSAGQTRPGLNAALVAHDPHGEEDVLAGAGTAVRIDATDGGSYLVTPRRLARVVSSVAHDMVRFNELVGYDWITPELSEKVAQKEEHYDRLYLYTRAEAPIVLDRLGEAVYPLMSFLGRVLEYRSQKVLLRKLDDDVVERLGRCLLAAAEGPFISDAELVALVGRTRESLRIVAGMWPRMNLAAPEVRQLLAMLVPALLERAQSDSTEWTEWVGGSEEQLLASLEIFRRVSTGEV
jgi:hypothetical protein